MRGLLSQRKASKVNHAEDTTKSTKVIEREDRQDDWARRPADCTAWSYKDSYLVRNLDLYSCW